jgi:hypothetical protein
MRLVGRPAGADPMPLVLNFVLLSLAGLLAGAALRATRLRAPKPLIRALYATSLVALALTLTFSLARNSGTRSHPAARSAPITRTAVPRAGERSASSVSWR